ncbi:RHS repeat-associated core domain-containing protein [Pseudomonas sp. NPDC089996]|uniref:RHS repeat-associated core domain-containing protein n=1 Tax=Pseudomonas sp. NPDC089996 TaxID=3364474 RepID=UPI0037FCF59E
MAPHLSENHPERHSYSAYGYNPKLPSEKTLSGFNGEHWQPVTASYHLGSGYRAYSPALIRFCSPDSWSPFGQGGINAYTYCSGDPVNRSDPSGHMIKAVTVRNQRFKITNNSAVAIDPKPVIRHGMVNGSSGAGAVISTRPTLGKSVGQLVSQFEQSADKGGLLTADRTQRAPISRAQSAPPQLASQPTRAPITPVQSSGESTPTSRSPSPEPLATEPYHVRTGLRRRQLGLSNIPIDNRDHYEFYPKAPKPNPR